MNFLPPASLVAETLQNVLYLMWLLVPGYESMLLDVLEK